MTLDEAKTAAAGELREDDCRNLGDFAAALEARGRLCHTLGEALRPDPPMEVVAEALAMAEGYRRTIASLARRSAISVPPPAAPSGDYVTEQPPEGTMDLLWDLGYAAGSFVRRLFGGSG